MKGARIKIEETFETPEGQKVGATFAFDVSTWREVVPYGSTTASFPAGEAICQAIYVDGKQVTERELAKLTGGGFDPERDWERLEQKAFDEAEGL